MISAMATKETHSWLPNGPWLARKQRAIFRPCFLLAAPPQTRSPVLGSCSSDHHQDVDLLRTRTRTRTRTVLKTPATPQTRFSGTTRDSHALSTTSEGLPFHHHHVDRGSGSPFSYRTDQTRGCRTGASIARATVLGESVLVYKGCKLVGCGSAIPKLEISNDDLANFVETSDDWISTRTGIRKRRVLSGEDSLTGLAAEAAKKALEMAQVDPDDIDLVLMCTSTPEDLFGSAPQVQRALGCSRTPLAYDITAACSGFMLGLVSAACHVRGGGFKNVLVVGADALSRFVDWTDRGTCILFGDAAGAVVVQACDSEEDGIFAFDLHSDGDGLRHLNASLRPDETNGAPVTNGSVTGFPPRRPSYSCINMNGKEVFRFAVRCVPQSIEAALQKAGINGSDIDWLLLHQANQRIIDAVATRLEVPTERVISNLANYGNTSAASIPLALDEAVRSGKVQPGHIIAASGFGAGLTWGSAILRWG